MPTQSIAVGNSVKGQSLVATRFGGGPRRLGIIGSLHGGDELPAYELLRSLPDAIRTGQLKVPAGLTLYLLPTLNPDDLVPETGFNARGVDLNRNFPTLWTAATCGSADGRYRMFGGCKATGGGVNPFSEPETQAARALVEGQHLSAVLVVSSGLNAVFSRNGGGGWGEELALDVSREFRVPYVSSCCAKYLVSGQLVDWADSLALRAVEVNAPAGFLGTRGRDLIGFVMQRVAASAATCTPTARTGEFALKEDAGESFRELGVIYPGEGATVKKWSHAKDDDAPAGDPWLYVELTRPNDGRTGWMFTRESNGERPLCDFDLENPATYAFPQE